MTMKHVKNTWRARHAGIRKHGETWHRPRNTKRSLHIQTVCKIDLVGSQRLGACWFDLHLGFNEYNYMLHLYASIHVYIMYLGMLHTYIFFFVTRVGCFGFWVALVVCTHLLFLRKV